nr:retrotransposon protein, putative, Ty1-copia subclass [Tanacetum cinerariifolium]
MSQEFLDHLKDHGIIAHRTPAYMPQMNGVSERRNRTLLDMVRSMMSQTTLPKSFWDYALESVARILNMVSTKKVDKTPYEIASSFSSTRRDKWDNCFSNDLLHHIGGRSHPSLDYPSWVLEDSWVWEQKMAQAQVQCPSLLCLSLDSP